MRFFYFVKDDPKRVAPNTAKSQLTLEEGLQNRQANYLLEEDGVEAEEGECVIGLDEDGSDKYGAVAEDDDDDQ